MIHLELSGSPSQMGSAHGEAVAGLIHELANTRLDLLLRRSRVTKSLVQAKSWQLLKAIEQELPDIYTEVLATARAAKIDPWLMVVAGGFTDVFDVVTSGHHQVDEDVLAECTTLLYVDPDSGGTILAGTWDSHASAAPALLLVTRTPDRGPKTVALTTAGWPVQQGFNSSGVVFATTNLIPMTAGSGLPYIAVLAELSSCSNTFTARNRLSQLKYASGHSYLFGDRSGHLSGLETTASQVVDVFSATTTQVMHTNHYLSLTLAIHNKRTPYIANSQKRLNRLAELISQPLLKKDQLLTILSDHHSGSDCICRHGSGDDTRTCAAFVINAVESMMEYTDGPPCCGQKYKAKA